MKLITLGICSINLLYPSLIPIFYLLRMIVNQSIITDSNEQVPFFSTVLVYCGQLLGGVVCLIITFILKRGANKETSHASGLIETKKHLITVLVKKKKTKSIGVYLILVMIVMLDGISLSSQSLLTFYYKGEQLAIMMKVFQLITTSFYSKLLLGISFHRHQALAIALVTLGTLPRMYSFFESNNEGIAIAIGLFFGIIIVNAFGISFYSIGQKHLFEKEFFSLTEMLLMEGATGFILNVLFISSMGIPCNTPNWFCEMMFMVPKNEKIVGWLFNQWDRAAFVILSVVLSGILNVCYALTNKIFNPTHRGISDCFCYVLIYIYEYCSNPWDLDAPWRLVMQWLANLALIFGTLIYAEYIILHYCNFEKNTKKMITERCNDEIKQFVDDLHLDLLEMDNDNENNTNTDIEMEQMK